MQVHGKGSDSLRGYGREVRDQKSETRLVSNPSPLASIVFTVSDTGIGMTPEQLAKLFQAFTQANV